MVMVGVCVFFTCFFPNCNSLVLDCKGRNHIFVGQFFLLKTCPWETKTPLIFGFQTFGFSWD